MRNKLRRAQKLMHPVPIPEPNINPQSDFALITLASGKSGEDLFTVSGPLFKWYAEKHKIDFHVITGPTGAFPCGRKWEVYPYFKHYKRILWLDADIVIDPRLDNMFDVVPVGRIGIHDDMPMLQPDTQWILNEYTELAQSQGYPLNFPDVAWNSGVWVADQEHAFCFEQPKKPYPTQWCMEQWHETLLIHQHGVPVTALSSLYNWEWYVKREPMVKPIPGARVYHWAGLYFDHSERFRQMKAMAAALYP